MKIVIVGAGYAGLLCAFRTRRLLGARAHITVVSTSDVFVERVRHHERGAGARPVLRPLAPWLASRAIDFVRGELVSVDREAHEIKLRDRSLPYDRLVLALGSRVDPARLPGALSFDQPEALAARVASLSAGQEVVVIGAGLTGLECASELKERRPELSVTLLSRGRFAPMLSAKAEAHARAVLDRLGVRVMDACDALAVSDGEVRTTHGALAAKLAIDCGGFVAPPVLATLGLPVDSRGFLLVDPTLRTSSDPHVYAIGDAASVRGFEWLAKSCKTAMPLGAHAADELAREALGQRAEPFRFRDSGVCVSLGRRDAVIQGNDAQGSPTGLVLTGAMAVWVKEQIVRYTVWSLGAEATARLAYRWMKSARVPTLDAALAGTTA